MSNTTDEGSLILQLTAALKKNFLCHVVMLHLVQTRTHTHTQKKKKEEKKKKRETTNINQLLPTYLFYPPSLPKSGIIQIPIATFQQKQKVINSLFYMCQLRVFFAYSHITYRSSHTFQKFS